MPAWCAAERPAHNCSAIGIAWSPGTRPRAMTVERSSPSTNDIEMYLRPSAMPRSWMRTTLRCVTWRATDSSRRKRASASALCAKSARMIFSATRSPSSSS